MKIKKDDLKRALEIVKPGLANKEIIEQATSFAFIEGRVVTYNDEISVSHPIKDLEITGTIRAEELYKFLGKIKEEEIDVNYTESEIVLKCGRATTGFAITKEILLPLKEEISEKGKWKTIPTDFCEAMNFAAMSCSSDMTNPKLICVHVNQKGYIEGSDNFRIVHYIIDELPVETFLIPASSAKIVIKLNPTKISEGNGWVHFKTTEGTVISCRVFKETYVDSSQYIKPPKNGKTIKLPETLSDVLDKAIIFAKREQTSDEVVEINIQEKKLTVESKSDFSWFKESIPIKYEGKTISFSVTPYLLKDILKKTNECTLNSGTLYFKSESWIYVTSLLG